MSRVQGREESRNNLNNICFPILGGLLAAYFITLLGLFIIALLLLQFRLSANTVENGILILYILSVFLAGFLMGKMKKEKKYLWGLLMGIVYYLILLILSLAVQKSLGSGAGEIITTFILCAGGGTLGGMLS
ncbi:MAG: TIGR04086 family membrane protein [Lachnospiraceae bacterium]